MIDVDVYLIENWFRVDIGLILIYYFMDSWLNIDFFKFIFFFVCKVDDYYLLKYDLVISIRLLEIFKFVEN